MEQPAFTQSRTPAGGGSPYTEGTLCFAFCRSCPGSPGSCSPQERFPHKRPVTCGHRPASPDACGRDFRCAVAPLKCGRNLRFPHKRPLPKMPPAGGSVPWRPRQSCGNAKHPFPRIAPPAGHKSVLNPCRKAHRNYSLFTILYSLVSPRRNLTPRQTHPTSRERQRIAPRRGAALKCGRNLRFPHKRPLQKRGAGVCG